MKKILYVLAFLFGLAFMAQAQEPTEKGKVYVGFATFDYELNKGVNASAQLKLYGYGDVKVEAVADAAVFFYDEERFYTLQAGPQVGVNFFHNRLNPFARVLFGASKDEGHYSYMHSVGAGIDVNVTKRIFLRGTYDRQSFERVVGYRTTLGAGLRF